MIEFEQSVCDIAAVVLFLVVLSLVRLFVLVPAVVLQRLDNGIRRHGGWLILRI